MAATDASAELSGRRRALWLVVSLVLGVVVGLLVSYVTAVVTTAQIPGAFTINPLTLVMIAVVGAMAVLVGWRWPVVGATAGIVILGVVAFAVSDRIAWSGSTWLDPFNALAYGAASGYPTLVGAVILTVSALSLLSDRAR